MPEKNSLFSNKYIKMLTVFVTVIIPLFAWTNNMLPSFVYAEDLEALRGEQYQLVQQLNKNQSQLKIEFLRSEKDDVEQDRLRLEREIYNIEKQQEDVPPFYREQQLRYDQKLERIEEKIKETQNYRLQLESDG